MPKRRRTQNATDRERAWRLANPERVKSYGARWRAANAEKMAAYKEKAYKADPDAHHAKTRAWNVANPGGRKLISKRNKLSKYGLTIEQFDSMWEAQQRACPACGSKTRPVVDHCHTTGNVRGILCSPCNTALGFAKDNPDTLRKLALYLEASRDSAT